MDDLGVALRELAGQATAPGVGDPARLWQQGRARVRRRRVAVGSLLAAVVVAVAGFGTYAVVPSSAVSPADQAHAPALPRNVWPAPGWLPSTTDDAPGTVAVLGPVGDGAEDGFYVVSATTGEYRMLDLPDYDDVSGDHEVQLSPDGNHVAYWYSYPRPGAGRLGSLYPDGVALYDTRTGDVARWEVPAEDRVERFQPPIPQSIIWVAPDVVAFTGSTTPAKGAGTDLSYAWNVDEQQPHLLRRAPLLIGNNGPSADGRIMSAVDDRQFGALRTDGTVDPASVIRFPGKSDGFSDYVRVTRKDTTVIAAEFGDEHEVFVGKVGRDGTVTDLEPSPGLRNAYVLGWISRSSVLVLGEPSGDDRDHTFYVADLDDNSLARTGSADGAGGTRVTNGGGTPYLQVASELLDQPMVAGVHPPSMDPRLRLALTAAGSVALAGTFAGLALWWRRRRA